MANNKMIFVLFFYLVSLSLSSQVQHLNSESNAANVLVILNTMMKEYQLPSSKQIPNCFTNEDKAKLFAALTALTNTASEAGTTQLKNFPNYLVNYTNSMFGKDTMNCFYLSRDFQLLIQNFNTDFADMSKVFGLKVEKSYLEVHKYFGDLRTILQNGKDQQYGLKLNSIFRAIFGSRIITENQWTKTVKKLQNFNPREYYGVSVSNGVIGAVSSIQPISVSTTVLAGAYDVFGRGRVDNIVETFPALQLQVDYGYDITSTGYYNYEQSLKLDSGQFEGAFSSDYCSVKYSYVALKNLPFAFYTSLELVAHQTTQIGLKLKHKVPDYLNNIQKLYENIDSKMRFDIMHTKATTKTGKLDLVIASSFMLDQNLKYGLMHEDWDSNLHYLKLKLNVTKGSAYKFGTITCLMSTAHHQDPQNQAIRIVQRALSIGGDTLLASHRKYWANLWKNDIIIEGNDADQKNVRLMLYHCYAFINDWKSYGISPMGLSGLGYNGHVFWDMDLWIYPGVLALNPELAKTLIEYRFQRLQAARNNAFINGYKGAMYPWQSSSLGVEQTPVWALTGPLQHHISGCVAFAAWNYFCVTQDLEWLRTKGYPIISSVAQFWQSRVQLEKDGYHIYNVVAADQWAQNVDDNAFTNAVAKQSLSIANLAANKLSLPINENYQKISEGIVILQMEDGVTREHRTYHGQSIKQADVNLLSFPLKTIIDPAQITKDLIFYQSRIPNVGTPAMTYSIFTILYSRLKDSNSSYKYFKESFLQNLRQPFNVFSETKGGTNPYFMTGAGGVIQSMVFGYGGYDITENGLKQIETVIPKEWKKVTIKGFLNCSNRVCENSKHSD